MRARGIFITATDTEVGKTIVGAALTLALKAQGIDVGVAKPFATEGRPNRAGQLVNADARLLLQCADAGDPLDDVNPICLKAPLAPAVAARRQGVKIDLRRALAATQRIVRRHRFTIVEGCGGLFVPITPRRLLIDLLPRFDLPILLVARAGLGTINHTLLSLEALRQRGLEPLAVLLNSTAKSSDLSLRTNAQEIARHGACPVLGPLPFQKNFRPDLPHLKPLARHPALRQLIKLINP